MRALFEIKHKNIALLIAGALASLCFAPIYALPLFFLGLFFALELCDRAQSCFNASMMGYMFGFGFFAAGFYWVANALLIDVMTFGWLYPITILGAGSFFGLFWVLPFVVWHALQNENAWLKILAFSNTVVLMEYIRSFAFTGFPWNMLGTMLAFSPVFIQTASLIGTYGLSFLVLLWGGCLYAAFHKHFKNATLVFVCSLAAVLQFGAWRLASFDRADSNIKVRLVQPSIAQEMKWNQESLEKNLQTYINMSRANNLNDVKFVVWGETATAFNPEESLYFQNLMKQAVPQKGYLITGLLRYNQETDKLYNSMSVIDEQGKTVAYYDKNHLVPFGEYIPFRRYLPTWVRPVANQIADFSRGEKYKTIELKGLPKFSGLICYEIIFEDEVINRKNKPEMIILVSNDGWYGKSSGPYQHLISAQMRAVEEGLTVVRSANNGISAVINPLGQIIAKIDLNQEAILDVFLPKNLTVETLYSHMDGISVQAVMLLMLLLILSVRNKDIIKK